jgi:hypothetical protein
LFIGQAFLYNSIAFGLGDLLSLYLHTPSGNVGLGAVMMILGGIAELFLGVNAERRSLESIARPLTARLPGHDREVAATGVG